jgi:prepilin-type N-terminal cleavage/methylation domain-containing protein
MINNNKYDKIDNILIINRYIMINNKKAFTLVELIVTITIVSVLATIAFVSFQWYRVSARDSVRLSDMWVLNNTLNYYHANNLYLPDPSELYDVTYSWTIVWSQWIFWQSMLESVQNMNQIPTDPLTGLPYTYSVLNNKQEFQIAWILEWNQTAFINSSITPQAYVADNNTARAIIKWNYNWKIVKTSSGTTTYILAVPTIISWDISLSWYQELINQQKLVYKNYSNLPGVYENSDFDSNWGFDFSPNKIILFEWNINDIVIDESKRIDFLINMQDAYKWTIIESESVIAPILSEVADIDNITVEVRNIAAIVTSDLLQQNIQPLENDSDINFNGTPKSWNYLPDDLSLIYRKWSKYIENWDNNTCDYENMNIVSLSPGTDTIPSSLIENTIYSLSPWDYIVSWKRIMNNCTALIWDKNNPVNLYSNIEITSEGILDIRPKEWIIIHGINIDWESDGNWSTHNKNITAMNFRFSKNLSINNVEFNNSNVWLYIYDSTNINIINTNASYNNLSWFYSYWSGDMLFENINAHNNGGNWIFTNASGTSQWDNIFKNIRADYNTENWIRIYGNEWRKLTNIITHNNSADGINIFYWLNTYLDTVESYENWAKWVNIQHETWLSLTNIKTYNNISTWLYTYAVWNIRATDIETHDNLSSGFYNLSEKWTNYYTNVVSHNNTDYWFYIRNSSSINDVINKITTHSNGWDGILLYGTHWLTWSELISHSNTGDGMEITYNEWWITILNSNFYNNNWSWINTWATWNMNISQVNTFNNLKSWIFNSATKLSNIFTNIKTFNNSENWFYIRSSWSKNDSISHMLTYNNGTNGVHLYQINEVDINNIISYNNSHNGYVTWYSANNTINNSQFFNNGQTWIYYNIWNGNLINNSITYNNGLYGLYLRNSQWNKLNNVSIYNNSSNALYSYAWWTWDGSWEYYGTLTVYDNGNNNTPKLSAESDTYLGFDNWILNNSTLFNSDEISSISNLGWNINTKWKQSVVINWNETYTYWINIPKQSQPIKYDWTNHILYGTDWNEYNADLYITE